MTLPISALSEFLGTRQSREIPNVADNSSAASIAISGLMLHELGLADHESPTEGATAGAELEKQVRNFLESTLNEAGSERVWQVDQPGLPVDRFDQYAHLAELRRIIDRDETGVLAVVIGRDYDVKPDVTVGQQIEGPPRRMLLHASVSCKLTLRSDRAQNIRLEAGFLTRNRRGRQPHIVAVTAEPLPTRLLSLTRGTGHLDALYHVCLPELIASVQTVGNKNQQAAIKEMVSQRRLLDISDLTDTLTV